MIFGIGSDLIEIRRIQESIDKHGDRFLERVFTPREREIAKNKDRPWRFYAKRFAAKEACLKALGTGMIEGFKWHDIQVENNELGKPEILLSGKAAEVIEGGTVHLTLTDTEYYAQAFVVIEK
jgi:holo-[acyl-carrier protein] synthase